MTTLIIKTLLAIGLASVGYYLIDNSYIFAGVFLMIWANNIGEQLKWVTTIRY